MKTDGRKYRWFDCNWNNPKNDNCCTICRICKYMSFLDYAGSVGLPSGSVIDYKKDLDKYIKMGFEDKQKYLLNN